jgi:hypothetical protein
VAVGTGGGTRVAVALRGAVLGWAALLAAACAGGTPPRHSVPRSSQSASASGPAGQALAARYLAIARPANHRLDTDFGRLDKAGGADLAAVRADLLDIAATERLFDRQLAVIPFPPAVNEAARSLTSANQSRAALTTALASVSSADQLQAATQRLPAANKPVEAAARAIRAQLGLPPPETS